MKLFLEYLVRIIAKIYTLKINTSISNKFKGIYSLWIKQFTATPTANCYIGPHCYIYGGKAIKIGNGTRIAKCASLTAITSYKSRKYSGFIDIGENGNIGEYCHLTALSGIKIGKNFLAGKFVTISDNNHGDTELDDLLIAPEKRTLQSMGETVRKL